MVDFRIEYPDDWTMYTAYTEFTGRSRSPVLTENDSLQ